VSARKQRNKTLRIRQLHKGCGWYVIWQVSSQSLIFWWLRQLGVRLDKCCIGSCSGGFLLSLLEFGDPCGLVSSVRMRVRSLLCAVFDWKHSRISMLDVEAVPRSCIP
jgi:hypothetical protein